MGLRGCPAVLLPRRERRTVLGVDLPTDRWLLRCTSSTAALGGCVGTRLTPASFDMRQAHQFTQVGPPGFFLGDYQGLTATGSGFLAVFAEPRPDNSGTIYAAPVSGRRQL